MISRSAALRTLLFTATLLATAFVAFPALVAVLGIDLEARTSPLTYLLFLSALYVVDVAVALVYLRATGRDLGFLDVRALTLRQAGVVVLTVLAAYAVGFGFSAVAFGLALPLPPESIFTQIELRNPLNYLVFAVFALLVNGPVEEILFRGIVQKELMDSYGRWVALAGASAMFSLYHLSAFYLVLLAPNPPLAGLVVGLVAFFFAGVVLGAAYLRTDNLTVPILAHGVYNATLAVLFYLTA